jgi:hypothetical protein
MSTDLDTTLRDSLERHVRAVTAPRPDVAGLVRRGRRRRGRRLAGVSALTVAALAGVATIGVAMMTGSGPGDGARPQRGGLPIATRDATGPTPVDGPTGLFVTRSRVYLDGSSYAVKLPWDTGAHVGRLGVAYPQPGSHRPMLLKRDGSTVPLAPATPAHPGATYDGWVAADGNGTLVAWAEQTKQDSEVVVLDTRSMKVVGRVTLPCVEQHGFLSCPLPYVVSDGVVFLDRGTRSQSWDPATNTFVDLGQLPSQAHHRVVTTFEDRGTVPVDRIGPGWEQAHSPRGVEGILSYDGGWILDNGGNPKVVNWRDPSQTITYRPPGEVAAAVFDTDGSVLVVTVTGDPSAMAPDGGANANLRWTGWDCKLEGPCRVVVPEQKQEIRLVAWDL